MKSQILMIISALLVLMTLKPVHCLAQAEINPDHYNATGIDPVTRAGITAQATRKTENLHGSFALPFDVKCAGLTLSPGTYSFSVRSLGRGNAVAMIRKGNATQVEARVKFRPGDYGPSGLLLERTGKQHTLTAINLKEQKMMLFLQAEQRPSTPVQYSVVPISYATRETAGQ